MPFIEPSGAMMRSSELAFDTGAMTTFSQIKTKKYLGKLHRRNDYVIRDISVVMDYNEEDSFQSKFGDRLNVSSNPGMDRNHGNWTFYGGDSSVSFLSNLLQHG